MAVNLEIAINLDDVKLILADRFDPVFHRAMDTNTCYGCKRQNKATLLIREIWLNAIGDIIVEGTCKDCGFRLSRYIEANNEEGAYDQAQALRELKMEVLKDYRARPAGG